MKNIVLIGMMGSGKTTVGRLLSRSLGRELVDTDRLIEEREGRTVSEIFASDGEGYFRALEQSVSEALSLQKGLIIACGGGLPINGTGISALRSSGIVFWLDRDPGQTYDSLDTSGRPLAQAGRNDFIARYNQRAPIYSRWAHHVISNTPSADSAAREILSILHREENAP